MKQVRTVGKGWQGSRVALSPGDLDMDGRRDLVSIREDATMFYYSNQNGRWGAAVRLADGFQASTIFA